MSREEPPWQQSSQIHMQTEEREAKAAWTFCSIVHFVVLLIVGNKVWISANDKTKVLVVVFVLLIYIVSFHYRPQQMWSFNPLIVQQEHWSNDWCVTDCNLSFKEMDHMSTHAKQIRRNMKSRSDILPVSTFITHHCVQSEGLRAASSHPLLSVWRWTLAATDPLTLNPTSPTVSFHAHFCSALFTETVDLARMD